MKNLTSERIRNLVLVMGQEKVNEVMKEMVDEVVGNESTAEEFFSWVTVDLLNAFSFESLLPSGQVQESFGVSESFRSFALSLVVCGDKVIIGNYKNNDARRAS